MKWLLILFLFLASHFTYAETVSEGVGKFRAPFMMVKSNPFGCPSK